ncbi:CPBP family intramembrane metalloprotease [Clostridium sp. YIM B02505]|uniref:CPBP family intramembrane metalloprotease n=1 Tax=Clostridium yunnanense TaxID=2800325 RepID=A0ABS1EVU9_9CLOT|nr:type II CAAX endopeptidase family protein [Clostridium yunnanense]MBK1813518.1 CPBP family intramembrane metalloprotease [Clostridium yunnanense]
MNLRKLMLFNPLIDLEEEVTDSKEIGILGGIWIAVLFSLIIPVTIQIILLITTLIAAAILSSYEGLNAIKDIFKSPSFLLISSIFSLMATVFIMNKFFLVKTNLIFPERKFKKRDIIGVIFLILGFRLLFSGSLSYILDLIPIPKSIEDTFNNLFINPFIGIFSAVVIAPIQEEFVNRGIILNGLAKKYSSKVALILSSLIFAAMHMNIPQGINAFLLGLILGYVYLKTKSILLTTLCHAINNILAFMPELGSLSNIHVLIAISILVVIIGIILMLVGLKRLDLKNRQIHFDSLRKQHDYDDEFNINI